MRCSSKTLNNKVELGHHDLFITSGEKFRKTQMDFHLQLPFQDWTLSLQQRGEIAVIEVNTILAS